MVNRITSTPIYADSHNHWGLVQNNMQTKNCVMQSDGTLWTIAHIEGEKCFLMKSIDNGFSWSIVRDDLENITSSREVVDLNADGPFSFLVINEDWDFLDVYQGDFASAQYDIERVRYELSTIETDTASNTTIETDIYQGQFTVTNNTKESHIFFVDTGNNEISCIKAYHSTTTLASQVDDDTTPVFNIFDAVMDEDSTSHILFTHQTGGENIIKYMTYIHGTGFKTTPDTISNFGDTTKQMQDPSIAVDGLGNLCAVWTRVDGATVIIQYATSVDSGTNWDVNNLTRTSGHAAYTDAATSDPAGRTQVIGSATGGF